MARTPNRPRDPRRYNAALSFSKFCPPRHDVVGPLPHMRGLCRCGCGERLAGRQTQWRPNHVDKPLRDFRIAKGDSKTIRRALFERDKGVCAQCGLDTVAEAKLCFVRWDAPEERRQAADAQREKYMLLGFPTPHSKGKSWWEAHHCKPIVEGGENSLENLSTVCVLCHRAETKALAARRAKGRRPDRTEQFAFAHAGPAYGKFAVSR